MRYLILSVVAALTISACATPTQIFADAEVERLCSIDGGIKVFETVILPQSKFNRWGQVNFYTPGRGEYSLGPDYIFKREFEDLRKTNGHSSHDITMLRMHYAVIRKSDGKLLGEATSYGRGGGDIPGPWHPSSFRCPPDPESGSEALFRKIFIPLH